MMKDMSGIDSSTESARAVMLATAENSAVQRTIEVTQPHSGWMTVERHSPRIDMNDLRRCDGLIVRPTAEWSFGLRDLVRRSL